MSQWYMGWCAKFAIVMDARSFVVREEEELQKDISFMMRVLILSEDQRTRGPKDLNYSPVNGHLKPLMRRYLEYLAKDLGDLNKGLIGLHETFQRSPCIGSRVRCHTN